LCSIHKIHVYVYIHHFFYESLTLSLQNNFITSLIMNRLHVFVKMNKVCVFVDMCWYLAMKLVLSVYAAGRLSTSSHNYQTGDFIRLVCLYMLISLKLFVIIGNKKISKQNLILTYLKCCSNFLRNNFFFKFLKCYVLTVVILLFKF
jgi:hypothetical protein